ncbi:MAG: SDR family NAD(P)-dependent oxidoreductase [Cyanobacteria bacterium MAG CAR2_bin_4]|nr:SDR family NAD(P)-dependent oxidoreductase [Cyanobacteria bacterium MAG CAR2_bin_4]MCY4331544.1 SDR family NAD(P)-dependent oxidoreductase [Cyanobacteria bacterium MAG CAR1_bin_15]
MVNPPQGENATESMESRAATLQGHGLVVADGALGRAMVRVLLAQAPALTVTVTGRAPDPRPETRQLLQQTPDRLAYRILDLCRDEQLAALASQLNHLDRPLRLVVNASGWLHGPAPRQTPEKRLAALSRSALHRSFAVNAWGPALLAQAVAPALKQTDGRAWFASLSARVGSIGDNHLGGWYSYRAAKAAQNQLLRTIALEWRRTMPGVCVACLHPGTMDSPLSRPFQARVPPAKLFKPEFSAAALLGVLLALTPQDSGGFWAWDGQPVPW